MSIAATGIRPRKAALAFIFVTVVLDMLALGAVIPVLPGLIEGFLGGNTARAAEVNGLFSTIWALMQFFSMPVMGGLSDRFGRRPVILLSNLGLGADYILMAMAPNLAWLFVGRVISGICAASISTAMAYIADVTPAEKRASSYGLVGMAFGVGFIFGPAFGGLLGHIDPHLPFWAAAVLSLANAAYGWLVLPESLLVERRRPFAWRRANPIGSLKLLRSHPELAGLASAAFLSNLAHAAIPVTFVLYATHRFGWDARAIGLSLAVVGASSALVQGLVVGPAVRRYGERRVMLAGLLAGALGYTIYAFAPSGAWFLVGVPVVSLWGLAGPAGQGLMTRRVGPDQQGALQGANGSIQGFATMIGPLLFAATFAWAIGGGAHWNLPGAAYLLAGFMLACAAILAARATRSRTPA
jgi:DHA1 family tetracycline resistance protein-like MFS transporter